MAVFGDFSLLVAFVIKCRLQQTVQIWSLSGLAEVSGIKCNFCGHNQNIQRCIHSKECPEDRPVCQVRVYRNDEQEIIFHYGCSPKNECITFNHHHQGRSFYQRPKKFIDLPHQICEGCCDTSDNCNMHLCSKYLPKPTTTTAKPTTTTAKPTTGHHNQHHHVQQHHSHHGESTEPTSRSTQHIIPTVLSTVLKVSTTQPTTSLPVFTATHYNGPACVDNERGMISCASLASQGFCTLTTSNAYQIARADCKKTCGFC